MPMSRDAAMKWWKHLDFIAHKLQADYVNRAGLHRVTANPRHTADILKGEAMLIAPEVDEICRVFSRTRCWPADLTGEQLYDIQHRLCCAKLALDFMTTYPDHETAIALQAVADEAPADPEAAPSSYGDGELVSRFLEWLLIPTWSVLSDNYFHGHAEELKALLSPEQLKDFLETDPTLQG